VIKFNKFRKLYPMFEKTVKPRKSFEGKCVCRYLGTFGGLEPVLRNHPGVSIPVFVVRGSKNRYKKDWTGFILLFRSRYLIGETIPGVIVLKGEKRLPGVYEGVKSLNGGFHDGLLVGGFRMGLV
jgi:hypothetical protein